jgi:hypothetical protein
MAKRHTTTDTKTRLARIEAKITPPRVSKDAANDAAYFELAGKVIYAVYDGAPQADIAQLNAAMAAVPRSSRVRTIERDLELIYGADDAQ